MNELGFIIWYVFRVLFIVLVFVFLISGLDDLFLDLVFYIRQLYRKLFRSKHIKPVTREQLHSVPEKPIAVMIPAWDESPIIQRMLLNTTGTFNYKNFVIFVGVYPNDEATLREVQKAREVFPAIETVITPADGPTNKADCLNWIYQGILVFEKEHDVKFEAFVMHDAEDIVHPLWLNFINYLMPRIDFIQLPVFPLESPWNQFVSGVYRDEFAENHTKDMRAREVLAQSLPSAGVGTALSRKTIEWLAKDRNNQIFDIKSLTEDYLLGILLNKMPGKKIFLQQWIKVKQIKKGLFSRKPEEKLDRQPVATREYFPNALGSAIRQKSRWILGISIQGWSAGWSKSLGVNYFLYRDRKALIANLATVLGYVVVLYWLGTMIFNRFFSPQTEIPPLVETHEPVFKVALIVMGIFVWRIVNRVYSTSRIYNFGDGLLAIPRLAVANIVNFCASVMAIRRFIQSKIKGETPAWGKTDHAWPSETQLRKYRSKLGDLLVERRLVLPETLKKALTIQDEKGGQLGSILVEMGVLFEEDLVSVLAEQNQTEAIEIDPHTSMGLLHYVPEDYARERRVYFVVMKDDTLVLAKEIDNSLSAEQAAKDLGLPVKFQWTTGHDIDFALSRGYEFAGEQSGVNIGRRLGERLVKDGLVASDKMQDALRKQKRTNQRLGDILLEMKLVTPEQLKSYLEESR